MSRIFYSLRFRLLLLVLLAIFPAFMLAIHNASWQREWARIQAEEDALRIARIAADHQNEMVEAGRQLLFVLAQMPALQGDDPQACSAFLSTVKSYNEPRYSNIVKADLTGRVLCDAISSNYQGKIPFDGFPERIVETRSFAIGNYIISPTSKKPTIGFGFPLLGEDGQVEAVLIAGLNLASLDDLISKVLLPPGSTFTMSDRHGKVVARYPDPQAWIGKTDTVAPITEAISAGMKEGTVEATGMDGVARLYAFAPLRSAPDAAVHIRVGIPTAVAYADANQMLFRSLGTLGLVAALAFVVAWVFSEFFLMRKVRALLTATNQMEAGDLSARSGLRESEGELNLLGRAFDRMGEALEKREKERNEAHEALIREEQTRARLLHNLITAHEDERIRIARELHDETSQSLTALMVGFDTTRMALGKDNQKAKGYLDNLTSIAGGMLKEIHRLIVDLRPSSLDDLGLGPAILSYGENRLKPAGITLHFHEDGIEGRLPPILETALFRIIQEAFTNILRHSSASEVEVSLAFSRQKLILYIGDNGRGFNPKVHQEGFGLQGIQERVRMLEGDFEILTAPGEGTEILIRVPIPKGVKEYA